eukprot:Tbor_TRINITY_DN6011_c0_g2::TRINITY_DN6011_c0_g2_i1::g.11675::m.11675
MTSFNKLVKLAWEVEDCPYPKSLITAFRRSWIGNGDSVTKDDLIGLEDDLDTFKEKIAKFIEELPPVCPELRDVIKPISTSHPKEMDKVIIAFRNSDVYASYNEEHNVTNMQRIGCSFRELSKQTTSTIVEFLQKQGIKREIAEMVAQAIYKRRREELPDNLIMLSPRSQAISCLKAKDKHINLSSCGLQPHDVYTFLREISNNKALRSLDISRNHIHINGGLELAKVISELPNLTSLNISGNYIQYDAMKAMCSALTDRTMEYLDVSCNYTGERTGDALGVLCVRNLNVAGNNIGSKGLIALAPAARHALFIGLSDNAIVMDSAAPYGSVEGPLCALLRACEYAAQVDISCNNIGHSSLEVIARALMGHPSIMAVDLSDNSLAPFDTKALESLLGLCSANTRIIDINLTRSSATESDMAAVSEACKANLNAIDAMSHNLRKKGIANWDRSEVFNAISLLMKRRDIAMKVPVDGQSLLSMIGMDDSDEWEALCEFMSLFIEG